MIKQALTKNDLIALFKEIGIRQGMILEVHTSLSKFGFCIGGAQTFNDALIETLGYNGTLIMPMQNGTRSEPSYFRYPPMKRELYQKYRDNLPSFDIDDTDSEGMGRVVENLRRRCKAVVSNHPVVPFVAYGKYARLLCAHQDLHYSLSDSSPLGRLYELKAHCLLAGVSYDSMTSLHLSEYRSGVRPIVLQGSKLANSDSWTKFLELSLNSDDGFLEIGKQLENKGLVKKIAIANGEMRLLRVDVAIDEGMRYFDKRLAHYHR